MTRQQAISRLQSIHDSFAILLPHSVVEKDMLALKIAIDCIRIRIKRRAK